MKTPTKSISNLVHLCLQFAEGQIATLNYLGPCSTRTSLINDLKQKVLYLLQMVREYELSLIEEVESASDNVATTAAKASERYIVSSKNKDDIELVQATEKEIIARLNEMEKTTSMAITRFFQQLKEPIEKMLEKIDRLPR